VVLLLVSQVAANAVRLKKLAVVLVEPLLNLCQEHFTTQTIDRAFFFQFSYALFLFRRYIHTYILYIDTFVGICADIYM